MMCLISTMSAARQGAGNFRHVSTRNGEHAEVVAPLAAGRAWTAGQACRGSCMVWQQLLLGPAHVQHTAPSSSSAQRTQRVSAQHAPTWVLQQPQQLDLAQDAGRV
jgi:hypothetical protein